MTKREKLMFRLLFSSSLAFYTFYRILIPFTGKVEIFVQHCYLREKKRCFCFSSLKVVMDYERQLFLCIYDDIRYCAQSFNHNHTEVHSKDWNHKRTNVRSFMQRPALDTIKQYLVHQHKI